MRISGIKNVYDGITNGMTTAVHTGQQLISEAVAGSSKMASKVTGAVSTNAAINGSELSAINNRIANYTAQTVNEVKTVMGKDNLEQIKAFNQRYDNYAKFAGAAGVGVAGVALASNDEEA